MFGLSPIELVVIAVVAILVFGPRLPQVAAEAGGWVVKLKRTLTDMRRDSGIDREIAQARREVENAIPRDVRSFDPSRAIVGGVQRLKRDVAAPVVEALESVQQDALRDRREPASHAEAPAELSPVESDPAAPPGATDHHPQ
jgi:Sec-independent protein translocase protein TatA